MKPSHCSLTRPGGRMTRTASVIALAGILTGIPAADLVAQTPGIRVAATPVVADTLEVATFAGGCFWCM